MAFGYEVAAALAVMRNEKKTYKDYLPQEALTVGTKMIEATKDLWDDVLDSIIKMLKDEMPFESPYASVWWYSILCTMKKDPDLFLEFVRYIRNNEAAFSNNTLFFLYYQLKSLAFVWSALDKEQTKEELWHLFLDVVAGFEKEVSIPLEVIPFEERNPSLVIVITEQLISIEHGPTKTALDRCKVLIDNMSKQVLLINTTEILSGVGMIPFMNTTVGNYMPEKKNESIQKWKGTLIPYYQCEHNMPDIDTMNQLLLKIRELAPGRVISIGGSSVLSNLVNKMIPVITVGLGPADLEYTSNAFQTLSRKVTEHDLQMLCRLGFGKEHVIESVFTSSLKPQTEKITRTQLGLAEDKFLLIVVGARLHDEVTDEFLQLMDEVMDDNMQLGFLGTFNSFETRISKFPNLMKKTVYLGFCSDILSRMEICDLYVNPLRKGGGTSCVEAMYMGVPVVTVDYGDVSVNVGKEFCVQNYEEMKQKILQYYTDKEYFERMSQKAKERTKVLLNTEDEFIRIMKEADQRELSEGKR